VKLSFVIPSRNQARFIRRCIDSCLAQGIEDSEILVVDGLSTDGTPGILGTYGDRIRWTSERDSGQGDAVNKGVAAARGDVIAWINSDDAYSGPAVLRAVLDAFDAEPRLELVFGDALVVDELGTTIRRYRNRAFSSSRELLVSPIGPSQPATFFRRDLFQRVGGLREGLHWALDYDLFLRMFEAARMVRYLPVTLALTTFHHDAKSIRGMLPQIREVARLKREHRRRIPLGLSETVRFWLGLGGLYVYWLVTRLGIRRIA